ncbi:hypothetical protein H310_04217 [Aphanomyces invadans]|uniref:Uncharacterized protein n=1 Tax=Aphanomyces invadans TaxID=157072 RepID=A0A024UFR7_9STRA|nr:hypothetical protein H310_04217 [Aphanomyces invadans]ETW05251.1 hypothetical protein H310_04217 [Aphanomyces invadans]|eukprot:XP_008866689.1 hypothetical protein H310_04217 [Aphanomyces invadans]
MDRGDDPGDKAFLYGLHFLVATDDELSADLSVVCDLLNESSSSDGPSTLAIADCVGGGA